LALAPADLFGDGKERARARRHVEVWGLGHVWRWLRGYSLRKAHRLVVVDRSYIQLLARIWRDSASGV
jgi:hypothetical protein